MASKANQDRDPHIHGRMRNTSSDLSHSNLFLIFLILSIAVAKVIRYEYLCILCRLTLVVISGFQSCTFTIKGYDFEPSTALGSTFSSKNYWI